MSKVISLIIAIFALTYCNKLHSSISEELMKYSLNDYYFVLLDIGYFPIPIYMFLNAREDDYLRFSASVYLVPDNNITAAEFSIKDAKYFKLDQSHDVELETILSNVSIKCDLKVEHKIRNINHPSLGLKDVVVHYIIIDEYIIQVLDTDVNIVFKIIQLYQEINCS